MTPTPRAQLAALDRLEWARAVIDRALEGHVPAGELNVAAAMVRDAAAAAVVWLEWHAGNQEATPVSIDAPSGEESIEWLVDVDDLDYVRQAVVLLPRRRGRPGASWVGGRLVGWSNLRPDVGSEGRGSGFLRRVFWLAAHDRDSEPDGVYRRGAPSEAVDPRTVAPRVGGAVTTRAWTACRVGDDDGITR